MLLVSIGMIIYQRVHIPGIKRFVLNMESTGINDNDPKPRDVYKVMLMLMKSQKSKPESVNIKQLRNHSRTSQLSN